MGIFNRIGELFKGEDGYIDEEETGVAEEYIDETDPTLQQQPAPQRAQAPARTPSPIRSTGGIASTSSLEMKVVKPERFDAVTQIGEHLLARRTVVLNLEDTNKETTKRIIDFLGGVVFAIDGQVKKVSNATYIVTPKYVDVSADQAAEAAIAESKPQRELF